MEKEPALRSLTEEVARINELREDLPHFVVRARMRGATWTEIGNALGVSKQAAQQRYTRYLPYEFDGLDD